MPILNQNVIMSTHLSINGRFFSQSPTGVQRYARQIVANIDRALLAPTSTDVSLVVPPGDFMIPDFNHVKTLRVGFSSGYTWEQIELPARVRGPLLNLCNLAPVLRSRQVVCIHDANVFTDPQAYGMSFRLVYRTLQPLLVSQAAKIATVSHFSARTLAKFLPVRVSDILVFPNGHEHVAAWDASQSIFFERQRDRPYVLLLGSRAKHKNAELILGLAEVLDQQGIDIYVAGGSQKIFTHTSEVERTNIVRLGFVSDNDLAALMRRALCLAFPSWTEGFGLPVLEAMALGCPVVSSDRASMPEVGGEAVVYAPPDAPDLWLKRFKSIHESQELRRELAEKGLARARLFSWGTSAQGYLEAARQL